jgi:predicted site-specific integrase-resolvase
MKRQKGSPKAPAKIAEPPMGVTAVARALNVSYVTVLRYCKAGLLDHVRLNGRIRVPAAIVARAQREGINRVKTGS